MAAFSIKTPHGTFPQGDDERKVVQILTSFPVFIGTKGEILRDEFRKLSDGDLIGTLEKLQELKLINAIDGQIYLNPEVFYMYRLSEVGLQQQAGFDLFCHFLVSNDEDEELIENFLLTRKLFPIPDEISMKFDEIEGHATGPEKENTGDTKVMILSALEELTKLNRYSLEFN